MWEQKGGNSMCCGSSVGELVESGLFFLNKLQKWHFHSYLGSCAEHKFSYSCSLMIYHHVIHIFLYLLAFNQHSILRLPSFFAIDSMQKCEHKVKGKRFSVWSKRDCYSILAISWSWVNYCELNAFVYLK